MEYDPFCVEEKIVSDICEVMKRDPQLEDYDIIPLTEAKNRSPVIHIQHNMGIEDWCVKIVYMYCYKYCLKLKPVWRKEHVRWEKYTRAALLLNPNIITFWNFRKRLINSGFLNHETDLLLTKIIVNWKPKCVEALTHRRWLLKNHIKSLNWVENELNLCTQMADKVKCNYHAWSHRQWIFNLCNYHSGWHHRMFLLQQFKMHLTQIEDNLEEFKNLVDGTTVKTSAQLYISLLNEELQKNEELILSFSGHETLWYYRRFLIQFIENFLPWMEESFLDRCLQSSKSDCNQQRFLDNHRRWLTRGGAFPTLASMIF